MRLFEYGFHGDGAKSLFGRPLVSIPGREKGEYSAYTGSSSKVWQKFL